MVPKTELGRWSAVLILAMFVFLILGSSLTKTLYDSVSAGDTILQDIAARPVLAISMLLGFLAGIAGFVTGFIALAHQKEKAIVVYISTFIGAMLTIFVILELLFPH